MLPEVAQKLELEQFGSGLTRSHQRIPDFSDFSKRISLVCFYFVTVMASS